MTHIRDHYQNATVEFRQSGVWRGLDIKAAHVASYSIEPDANPMAGDFLILTDEGLYHAWGPSPNNIRGKTFNSLTAQEIAELEKVPLTPPASGTEPSARSKGPLVAAPLLTTPNTLMSGSVFSQPGSHPTPNKFFGNGLTNKKSRAKLLIA